MGDADAEALLALSAQGAPSRAELADGDGAARRHRRGVLPHAPCLRGVYVNLPLVAKIGPRHREVDVFVMGVEHEEEGIVHDSLAPRVRLGDGLAVDVGARIEPDPAAAGATAAAQGRPRGRRRPRSA